jgi:hypothetical protein
LERLIARIPFVVGKRSHNFTTMTSTGFTPR